MEGYCRSCGRLEDLEGGLCPVCLEDFKLAVGVKAKHSPHLVDMSLECIARAAEEIPTTSAYAFYDGAVEAILKGSAYGWPRK